MRLIAISLGILLITGCSSSSQISAEEKRNNFDVCKINFLKQIPKDQYKSDAGVYAKQAEEGCAPLLTAEKGEAYSFVPPTPSLQPKKTPSLQPKKTQVTFDQVCAKIKRAAYAHNEFRNNDEAEDFYDRWYGRIRSYFREAASMMRSMSEDYSDLIADAQSAAVNARGVNAGLTNAEESLYVACNISEDGVWKDFEKWLGI
jgi:hypothetical protein